MSNFFSSYLTPNSGLPVTNSGAFLKMDAASTTSLIMASSSSPVNTTISSAPIRIIDADGVMNSNTTFHATTDVLNVGAVRDAQAPRIISAGGGSVGTDTDATTTAAGSAASSFSAKLGGFYVGSLPESILLPLLCQQQQLQQQQQQQAASLNFPNIQKEVNSPFVLNAQSIATTMQSILSGHAPLQLATPATSGASQTIASSASWNVNTSASNTLADVSAPIDVDMCDDKPTSINNLDISAEQQRQQLQFAFRNAGGLATSLPPMSLFLNNFINNTQFNNNGSNNEISINNSKQQQDQQQQQQQQQQQKQKMDTGFAESVIDSLKLGQNSRFQRSVSSSQITGSRSQDNNSRTTSESSTTAEEHVNAILAAGLASMDTNATVASATNDISNIVVNGTTASSLDISAVPAVETLRHEAMASQRNIERSGSPLKMRSRLNSRNKAMAIERSATPPNNQGGTAEEDLSNSCNVCGDEASGRHYGASTCFGCKGFFRRTVRANKTYSCRYEERCEIDKIGRNTCRSCRFRKCLNVGMEPEAIRPDRDKTGRQRNPRRQSIALPANPLTAEAAAAAIRAASSHDSGAQHNITDDETTLTATLTASTSSESAATRLRALRIDDMVAERDLVIKTLAEIERICDGLRDVIPIADSANGNNNEKSEDEMIFSGELSQTIIRPSIISTRTQLEFTGLAGLIQQSGDGAETSARQNFQRAFRRLVTLSIDFANTLKPIADISVKQRENLLRSYIASYTVLLCAYRSVVAGRNNSIILPDGHFIDLDTPLSAFIDTSGLSSEVIETLLSKIRFICKSVIDSVQNKMEKLEMSEVEFVCLKAIIALDPSAPGMDASSVTQLSVARDSVQNALFYHLMDHHTAHAVVRFGQLLMLISNVSKIGALLYNVMEIIASVRGELANSATLRLFTGLERVSTSSSLSDAQSPYGAPSAKDMKMSDDSDDDNDEDDEMDDE